MNYLTLPVCAVQTSRQVCCMVNTMVADVLVTYGARASAAVVLAYFSWNIPVSTPEGLSNA